MVEIDVLRLTTGNYTKLCIYGDFDSDNVEVIEKFDSELFGEKTKTNMEELDG